MTREYGGQNASSFDSSLHHDSEPLQSTAAPLVLSFPLLATGPRGSKLSTMDTKLGIRSFNGCWTCRLRRKKCNEIRPICGICASLNVTCHFSDEKPVWMDGGERQKEAAARLKSDIRQRPHRRRVENAIEVSSDKVSRREAHAVDGFPLSPVVQHVTPRPLEVSTLWRQNGPDSDASRNGTSLGQSDAALFMFYLENVLPFLYPFYRLSIHQGDKSWILDMLISRPVVRRAILCQSSYFFALMRGTADGDIMWREALSQTKEAFEVLRQALQVLNDSEIVEQPHCAVRILTSIIQLQRLDITAFGCNNWRTHFNAGLALFDQLLESTQSGQSAPSFNMAMERLGRSPRSPSGQCSQITNPEQAAFRFSAALLMFDDTIASTVLEKRPRLYEYHRDLLGGIVPPINLEHIIGIKNWVVLYIGEASALDAWKQDCSRAGDLDVMELAHRARAIKEAVTQLLLLEPNAASLSNDITCQSSKTPAVQSSAITCIWAHGLLIYLSIVVSGWQPASKNVRYYVKQVLELLKRYMSLPALLRTMVWPFCIAGCLAEPSEEPHFREIVEVLQPRGIFGTLYKALEIMENVWRNRDAGDIATRDLAWCFSNQDDIVLLV